MQYNQLLFAKTFTITDIQINFDRKKTFSHTGTQISIGNNFPRMKTSVYGCGKTFDYSQCTTFLLFMNEIVENYIEGDFSFFPSWELQSWTHLFINMNIFLFECPSEENFTQFSRN